MKERYTFRVRRFDPEGERKAYYQEYSIDVPEGMTVLEALLLIQAEHDGSLAFRYVCRGAVCGSCAMVINGHVGLACRTQVHGLEGDAIAVQVKAGMECGIGVKNYNDVKEGDQIEVFERTERARQL